MTTSGPSTSRKTFQKEHHGTTLTLQVHDKSLFFYISHFIVIISVVTMLFAYCRGSDGAGNDWSISKSTYFVLPQICNKFSGEKKNSVI